LFPAGALNCAADQAGEGVIAFVTTREDDAVADKIPKTAMTARATPTGQRKRCIPQFLSIKTHTGSRQLSPDTGELDRRLSTQVYDILETADQEESRQRAADRAPRAAG
jgi:hypothetical protein